MELYPHMHIQYTHYKFAVKQRLSSKSATAFKAGCSHFDRSLASFDVVYLHVHNIRHVHTLLLNDNYVQVYIHVHVCRNIVAW